MAVLPTFDQATQNLQLDYVRWKENTLLVGFLKHFKELNVLAGGGGGWVKRRDFLLFWPWAHVFEMEIAKLKFKV